MSLPDLLRHENTADPPQTSDPPQQDGDFCIIYDSTKYETPFEPPPDEPPLKLPTRLFTGMRRSIRQQMMRVSDDRCCVNRWVLLLIILLVLVTAVFAVILVILKGGESTTSTEEFYGRMWLDALQYKSSTYGNSRSAEYQELEARFCSKIMTTLSEKDITRNIENCDVSGFSKGSVIVHFKVVVLASDMLLSKEETQRRLTESLHLEMEKESGQFHEYLRKGSARRVTFKPDGAAPSTLERKTTREMTTNLPLTTAKESKSSPTTTTPTKTDPLTRKTATTTTTTTNPPTTTTATTTTTNPLTTKTATITTTTTINPPTTTAATATTITNSPTTMTATRITITTTATTNPPISTTAATATTITNPPKTKTATITTTTTINLPPTIAATATTTSNSPTTMTATTITTTNPPTTTIATTPITTNPPYTSTTTIGLPRTTNTEPKYCEQHSPCRNGGTCINLAGDSYVCICPKCNCSTAEPFGDCEVDLATICRKEDLPPHNHVAHPYDCTKYVKCLSDGTATSIRFVWQHEDNNHVFNPETDLSDYNKNVKCARETVVRTVCADVTCANGGSCLDTRSGFKCACTAVYTGDKCEKNG